MNCSLYNHQWKLQKRLESAWCSDWEVVTASPTVSTYWTTWSSRWAAVTFASRPQAASSTLLIWLSHASGHPVEKSGQLKVLGQSSMKSLQRPHGNETKYERPRLMSPSRKGSSCSCHLLRFPLARIHCSGRVEGQSEGWWSCNTAQSSDYF